jgi:hypothetical protein
MVLTIDTDTQIDWALRIDHAWNTGIIDAVSQEICREIDNAANEAKLAWTLMCGVKRISLQIEETT